MEFLDENGIPVSPGEKGEIAYTSLFNYAMPLIRYAIGDVGAISLEECPCGRKLPLMKVVEGRRDSFLVMPEGRLLSPRVVTNAMSKFFYEIAQYRFIQKKIDFFEVLIQARDNLDENFLDKLADYLKHSLGLNNDVTIIVKSVDKIPLSKVGKLATVISEI
jgi:phenylacetate-CoA ligase